MVKRPGKQKKKQTKIRTVVQTVDPNQPKNPENETYSYHTFLYTFFWNSGADLSQIIKRLNQRWLVDYVKKGQDFSQLKEDKERLEDLKDKVQKYNEYHYFFEKARRMLLNTDSLDHDVMHWKMNLDHNCKTNTYEIQLASSSETIVLHLEGIKLSLYPKLSIGMLTIETEYRPSPNDPKKYENALIINDLGRRIFSPSYNPDGFSPCTAKEIDLCFTVGKSSEQEKIIFNLDWEFNKNKYNGWDGADHGIRNLLFGNQINEQSNESHCIFAKKAQKEKVLVISPIFDDRMFTACILKDTQWTQRFIEVLKKSDMQNGKDKHLFDEKRLYEYLFCDRYDYCSCQESDLRWQMIREHVYSRWIDYGSVYGITEYSMTFAATETVPDYLIDNFLTIYIDLAKLVLLQRAAIISLEARVAAYAAGDKIEKPIEIWRDYIYFQTSIMLPEASFQQQGVEMYDMLWKCLQIQRYSDYLGNEIHSFSEHARFVNDKQDEERDKRASHFSLIISIILAFSLFNDAYEGVRAIINANIKSFKDVFSHVPIVVAGILVVAIIILSLCVLIIGQNKKGRDKT